MSPAVCPRPQYCRTSSRSPPSGMTMRSLKVSVGQVSPGIESGSSNSRGIRPNSDSQSACPRSAMSLRVCSCVMISLASNALAPSTRTA